MYKVLYIAFIFAVIITAALYGKNSSTIKSLPAPTPNPERQDTLPRTVTEQHQQTKEPLVTPPMKKLTDTVPPKAYILSPENNQRVKSPFKIVANVTDNIKVDRVEFYAGSSDYQHIGTVYQDPFEVLWAPSEGLKGSGNQVNIPLYIKAFDAAGNRSDAGIVVFFE